MDWTGGVGRRYATAKDDSERRKQREFFAKARARHTVPSSQRNASQRPLSHEPKFQTAGQDGRDPIVVRSSPSTATPRPAAPSEPRVVRSPQLQKNNDQLRLELLKRPDWLGLSINQPLHRNKSVSRSSDRLDNRCGIRKTVRKRGRLPQPALSPVPEERPLFRPSAPPVFPDEESIRIKVGTDALASQTQPSRIPRPLCRLNTSMRAPSTYIERLSEDSTHIDRGEERAASAGRDPVFGARQSVEATTVHIPPTTTDAQSNDVFEDEYPLDQTNECLQEAALSTSQSETCSVDILALTYNSLKHTHLDQLSDDFEQQIDEYRHILDIESAADGRSVDAAHHLFEVKMPVVPTTEDPPPEGQRGDVEELLAEDDMALEFDDEEEDEDEKIWRRLQNINEFASSNASMDVGRSSAAQAMSPGGNDTTILWPSSDHLQTAIVSTPKGAGTQISFLPTKTRSEVPDTLSTADTAGHYENHFPRQDMSSLSPNKTASPVPSSRTMSPVISTPRGAGTQLSFLPPAQPNGHPWEQSLEPSADAPPVPLRQQPVSTDLQESKVTKQRHTATEPLWKHFVLDTDEVDRGLDLVDEAAPRVSHMSDREDLWMSSVSAPMAMSDRTGKSDQATRGQPTLLYEPTIADEAYMDGEETYENGPSPANGKLMYNELVDDMIDGDDPASWPDDSDDEIDDIEKSVSDGGTQGVRTSSILDYSRLLKRSPKKSVRHHVEDARLRRHQRFIEKRRK